MEAEEAFSNLLEDNVYTECRYLRSQDTFGRRVDAGMEAGTYVARTFVEN